jgi:hypothetical protein
MSLYAFKASHHPASLGNETVPTPRSPADETVSSFLRGLGALIAPRKPAPTEHAVQAPLPTLETGMVFQSRGSGTLRGLVVRGDTTTIYEVRAPNFNWALFASYDTESLRLLFQDLVAKERVRKLESTEAKETMTSLASPSPKIPLPRLALRVRAEEI